MALAAALSQADHVPDSVETTAQVTIDSVDGIPTITRSELSTEVKIDGLDDAEFQELAEGARSGCAVSRALAGVEITLAAKLA
jgi:osmotically inducible protein OsmC